MDLVFVESRRMRRGDEGYEEAHGGGSGDISVGTWVERAVCLG